MNIILKTIVIRVLEAIYFSLFLILGKKLKSKRILFTIIMIFEYIMLTNLIKFNVLFQFLYTFMSYINLKVLYREKTQITDIFLFVYASIVLILISMFSYFIVYFTVNNYTVALILNRILMFSYLIFNRDKLSCRYKKFYSTWNRHNDPNKIKSLTLRNVSVIITNLMFVVINVGMIVLVNYLK